jgi:prevent-host-death family protein
VPVDVVTYPKACPGTLSAVIMSGMIGVAETRRRFGEVIDRVLAGERVVVSRRGEPVAAIVPLGGSPETGSGEAAAETDGFPLGLGAVAGAMAGWDDLEEVIAAAVSTRSIAREREVLELE